MTVTEETPAVRKPAMNRWPAPLHGPGPVRTTLHGPVRATSSFNRDSAAGVPRVPTLEGTDVLIARALRTLHNPFPWGLL